eukprot:Plantae.Rhodophyta-Hildenbrandia_rubra.ctg2849.p2 GENE.Plantae.Rhodophyta-Hildenbrandia_rubra.ctg2849~~Plantae.Rhodophyta-Hildenbrandia_rubra.ctg2849.p2  ORF type:complete len:367 (-),score=78.44 Plantae.Rhodophyta-Hildenbrandia_rubra.ctg2849:2888-3988(-)
MMLPAFAAVARISLLSSPRQFLGRTQLACRCMQETYRDAVYRCDTTIRRPLSNLQRTISSVTVEASQKDVRRKYERGSAYPNIHNPYIIYHGNDIKITSSRFLEDVEEKLDYKFTNKITLAKALLHSSTKTGEVWFQGVNMTNVSNERLEFLGDSILNFLVSDYLYRYLPESDEGKLTAMRSLVTSGVAEVQYCQGLDIGKYLVVHKNTAGNYKSWNYYSYMNRAHANCVEAVLGAVYVDGGIEAVTRFFESKLMPMMVDILRTEAWSWKNSLQELLQSMGETCPDLLYFNIDENGAETEEFVGRCALKYNGERIGKGHGTSRSRAESSAAHNAIVNMGVECNTPTFENEGRILADKIGEWKMMQM